MHDKRLFSISRIQFFLEITYSKLVAVSQVTYGDVSVNLGNELTPTQVKDIPAVHWNADDGSYYLLCMTGLSQQSALHNFHLISNKEENNTFCLSVG